jgi:hypothetical protein
LTFLTWDDADQDKVLAWRAELADRCPGCGTQSWEDPSTFAAEKLVCITCQKLQLKRADVFETASPEPGKSGVHIVLRRQSG